MIRTSSPRFISDLRRAYTLLLLSTFQAVQVQTMFRPVFETGTYYSITLYNIKLYYGRSIFHFIVSVISLFATTATIQTTTRDHRIIVYYAILVINFRVVHTRLYCTVLASNTWIYVGRRCAACTTYNFYLSCGHNPTRSRYPRISKSGRQVLYVVPSGRFLFKRAFQRRYTGCNRTS